MLQYGLAALVLLSPWHELIVRLWRPLGAWDDLLLIALGAAALPRARKAPLAAPLALLWGLSFLSCAWHGGHWLALRNLLPFTLAGLAANQLSPEQARKLVRWMLGNAVLAAVYGLLTYAAFRGLGGHENYRPQLESPFWNAVLYPYVCGTYPRGWRLVGAFLNDNYMGAYLAAMVCLGLAGHQRLWASCVLLVAWAGTFSRAATAGLGAGLVFLALRWRPRLLLVLPLAALLCLPLLTRRDAYRFLHPFRTEGGRIQSLVMARDVLVRPALLGEGPGTRGLADMQYAKIAYELGWAGVLTFLVLLRVLLRAWSGPLSPLAAGTGAALVAVAVAGCGGEVLEVPQTAILFWTCAGLTSARC